MKPILTSKGILKQDGEGKKKMFGFTPKNFNGLLKKVNFRSIKAKLMTVVFLLVVTMLVIQGAVLSIVTRSNLETQANNSIYSQTNQTLRLLKNMTEGVKESEKRMLSDYDSRIKYQVNSAIVILEDFYSKYKDGRLTENQAKERALDLLEKNFQYADNKEIWIDDIEYRLVLYPASSSEPGTYRGDVEDSKGKKVIKEMIDEAKKNDETYVNYFIPKIGEAEPLPKRGYSKIFRPWGWVVSSADYIDNIENEIEQSLKKLQENMQNEIVELNKNGMSLVLDSSGNLLYYPDRKMIGRKFNIKDSITGEQIVDKILKNKNSFINFSIIDPNTKKSEEMIAYVNYDKDEEMYFVISNRTKDVFAAVNTIRYIIILIIIIASIIALAASYTISKLFMIPIGMVIGKLKDIANGNGDLTEKITIASNDELGELARYFNEFVETIRNIVIQIDSASESVLESAETLSYAMEQTSSAIEKSTTSISQIAVGSSEQAEDAVETEEKITGLAIMVDHISNNSNVMRVNSENTQELNNKSINTIQLLNQKNIQTLDAADKIVKKVEELSDKATEINSFVEVIDGIVSQTSLLSLNATIEAARAGEHGRGFGVVAQEVQKLAEASRQSAQNIGVIVKGIQGAIFDTRNIMKDMVSIVEGQGKVVRQTEDVFSEINTGTRRIIESIEEVDSKIINMKQQKDIIIESVRHISEISNKTANSTNELAAFAEEQNATIEEMNASSKELQNMAQNLKQIIKKFKY